jgi:hypothetical protein
MAGTSGFTVTYPRGQKDMLRNLRANAAFSIQEGGNILAIRPFKR